MSSHTIPPAAEAVRRHALLRAVRDRRTRAVSLALRFPCERPRRWR